MKDLTNQSGRDLGLNDLKLRLYRCLIVPIAIYTSETWVCNAEDRWKLMVFENNCLRGLAGKTRGDKCRMNDLYQKSPRSRLIICSGPSAKAPAKLIWGCCQKRRKKPCIQGLQRRFLWKRTTEKTSQSLERPNP